MNPVFSIYLELARIVATLMVFVAHASIFYQPLADIKEVIKFGRDGVIIFFVLSGFVITWCANERDSSLSEFIVNRASRVYSVAIPGIVLGIFAAIFIAGYEEGSLSYPFEKLWIYLPVYLSFTGNFWSLAETPPANFPYWSLNYEVWYYIIFAAFFYAKGMWRWILGIIFMLMVGPEILMLFPLWLVGGMLYYWRDSLLLSVMWARSLLVLSLAAFIFIKVYSLDILLDRYNEPLWIWMFNSTQAPPQLLGDYLLGIVVFVNFIAARSSDLSFNALATRGIRYLASFSFSFYLFHIPIFSAVRSVLESTDSFVIFTAVMSATALAIMALAHVTEHKKYFYRNTFWAILNGTRRLLYRNG